VGIFEFTADYLGDWIKVGKGREWRNNVLAPDFLRVIRFSVGK